MIRRRIRALVIDDSAYNRKTISGLLNEASDVEVVGAAADGEEGLRLVVELQPEVITLDLEMPRMDGFTFLRILMSRRPTPVVVVSSYSKKTNVFRALELGAVDFVAKPGRFITEETAGIKEELLAKIRMVRGLQLQNLKRSEVSVPAPHREFAHSKGPPRVVAIGASTGGPPALQQILGRLPMDLNAAILIAQHMPALFTKAFAERLDRTVCLTVHQAQNDDVVERGKVLIAPGGSQMTIVREDGTMRVRLFEPREDEVYVPSIDRLLVSVADVAGRRAIGIVLTGMGRDGSNGIGAIKDTGGATIAESEATSVVYGMPAEAIETGKVEKVLPIDEIPLAIIDLVVGGLQKSVNRG